MVWQHQPFVGDQIAVDEEPRSKMSNLHWPIHLSFILGLSLVAGCTPPAQQVGVSPAPTTSPLPSPFISPTPLPTTPSPTPAITPSSSPTGSPSPTTEKPAEVVAIENQVKALVAELGELTVQSVNCPANLNEQSGNSYDCQVQSNVGSFVVVVQPTDQTGKFRWGTKGLLFISKLAPLIEKNFASAGNGKVNVDCGATVRTAKAGETFDCKIVDASGTTRTARVTVRDDQGNVYVTPL